MTSELSQWLNSRDGPVPDELLCEEDPCVIVKKTHTYLANNQSRMNYPEFRRQGLPTTSSLMESLIKEIN